jgi:hypothetical protein
VAEFHSLVGLVEVVYVHHGFCLWSDFEQYPGEFPTDE